MRQESFHALASIGCIQRRTRMKLRNLLNQILLSSNKFISLFWKEGKKGEMERGREEGKKREKEGSERKRKRKKKERRAI